MISKLGYGIFAQALMNGTPLIYLPRRTSPSSRCSTKQFGNGATGIAFLRMISAR